MKRAKDRKEYLPGAETTIENINATIAEGLRDYEEGRFIGPFTSVKEFKAIMVRGAHPTTTDL